MLQFHHLRIEEATKLVSFSECWPRAQELSPVTSSSAIFYAVVSTSGVWGRRGEPSVKMQQRECNQGSLGLALSVSGDGIRPFRGRVQFGETRKDKYPNSSSRQTSARLIAQYQESSGPESTDAFTGESLRASTSPSHS